MGRQSRPAPGRVYRGLGRGGARKSWFFHADLPVEPGKPRNTAVPI